MVWTVYKKDNHDLREPSVTLKNAKIIILHESQSPEQFNDYQHNYDYKLILQPILNNLLQALEQSGISRYDSSDFNTERVPNYSMRKVDESLVYVCNAIVFESDIVFSGLSSCIQTIQFNT